MANSDNGLTLRPYQEKIIDDIRASALRGCKRILVVLPTGAGKTIVMAEIVNRSVNNGHKALNLMHRRHLVNQMKSKYSDFGLKCGIIMAGVDTKLDRDVQIASNATYHRRLQLADVANPFFVDASVILVDEAHRSLSRTFQNSLSEYVNKIVIGFTATPCLASGVGMGNFYDDLIVGASVKELIDEGYLVPGRYYAPTRIDLDKLSIVAGDYHKGQLGKLMNTPKLVGDVFENWARLAGGLQTIVFAVNVKHSRALCVEFQRHGVSAEHLDAYSSDEERDRVMKGLRNKDIQVVCNVGLYTEGFDYPGAQCIDIARPTKSMGLWRQMGGRGLRPYPGKDECVFIDHGGCIERLGFLEDDVVWSLGGKDLAYKIREPRKKEKHLMTCEECGHVFEGNVCPTCGTRVKDFHKKIAALDAKLVEISRVSKKTFGMEEKRLWYGMFEYYRRGKGYSKGWTSHKYREKFGVWPKGMEAVPPIKPTLEFTNYIKYLMIRYVKGKGKHERKKEGLFQQ